MPIEATTLAVAGAYRSGLNTRKWAASPSSTAVAIAVASAVGIEVPSPTSMMVGMSGASKWRPNHPAIPAAIARGLGSGGTGYSPLLRISTNT